MSKQKVSHKFLDNHTIPGVIILMFGGMIISQFVIGYILGFLLSRLTGLKLTTAVPFGVSIGGIILLFFYYFWFRGEYNWKPDKAMFLEGIKLLSPILILWAVDGGICWYFAGRFPLGPIPLSSVAACLMAGISEEVAFRELPISYLTRQWKEEKYIPAIVLIPGVAFGLVHMTNMVASGSLFESGMQTVLSVFFGIFFSAVFLRTGCIWPPLIAHVLHDLFAFSSTVYIKELPDPVVIIWLVVELGLAIYGFYLVRRSKRPEILALWNRKWNRD